MEEYIVVLPKYVKIKFSIKPLCIAVTQEAKK